MVSTIIDIALGVIFGVALLVGLLRGFSKQFSKGLCTLLALLGAVALVAIIMPLISALPFYVGWTESAAGWFKADFYVQEVNSAEELSAVLSSGYLRILVSSSEKMFDAMSTALGEGAVLTVGNYFGKLAIDAIADFVVWLVLYLAIKYMLFGIKYLMQKIAKVPVLKTIDRILGMVWAVAITYIMVVALVLTIGETVITSIPSLAEFEATFAEWIEGSTLLKLAHDTNVIGSFLTQLLGLRLVGIEPAEVEAMLLAL